MRTGWTHIAAAMLAAALSSSAGCGGSSSGSGGGGSVSGPPDRPPVPPVVGDIDAGGATSNGGGPGGRIDINAQGGSIRIQRMGSLSAFALPDVPDAAVAGALVVEPGEVVQKSGSERFSAVHVKAGGAIELIGDYQLVVDGDVLIAGEIRSTNDPRDLSGFNLEIRCESGTRRVLLDEGGTITLRGGDVADGLGGRGGDCRILTVPGVAGGDQGAITIRGLIDTTGGKTGGSRSNETGGNGGRIRLDAAGRVRISGKLQGRGGDAFAGKPSSRNPADRVGRGAEIVIEANDGVEIVGATAINSSGGAGSEVGGAERGLLFVRCTGGAGTIEVDGTDLLCQGGGARVTAGAGGDIQVLAPGAITIESSLISACGGSSDDTTGGVGGTCLISSTGGTVTIDPSSEVETGGGDGARGGRSLSRTVTPQPEFDLEVEGLRVIVDGLLDADGGDGISDAAGGAGIVYVRGTVNADTAVVIGPTGVVSAVGGSGSPNGAGGFVRLEACGGPAAAIQHAGRISATGSPTGLVTVSPSTDVLLVSEGAVIEPPPQSMQCPEVP